MTDKNLDPNLEKWLEIQKRKNKHLEQMRDALLNKERRLSEFEGRLNDTLKHTIDARAEKIREMLDYKFNVENQKTNGSELADSMRNRLKNEVKNNKQQSYQAQYNNLASTLGNTISSVGNDKHSDNTIGGVDNYNLRELYLNKEKMKVNDETFQALRHVSNIYNILWQPNLDGTMLEATLPEYLPEEHKVFDFVYNGEIVEEIEIPVSGIKWLDNHFKHILYVDKSFNYLDFIEKIAYNLMTKKNHIKRFRTTEEHFMDVYKKNEQQ